jgi:hypothetical protein
MEVRVLSFRAALRSLLGLSCVASSTQAWAGAWTLEEGRGFVALTATASRATQAFDGRRDLVPTPAYDKFEFQGLFEYGVTDRLTAIVTPGLQRIDIAAPVDASRTGLNYTEGGARYRFLAGDNWVFSGQATVRVPGTYDTSNPAAIGYTGAEVDVRALFGAAINLGAWPAFLDLQAAQRFRYGGLPSEFRFDVTLGVRFLPRWLALAQVFNVISEGDSPPIFPSYDYSKLQLSVVYDLTKEWSLQAGGFRTFSGRNALQENALLLGGWYKF